MSRTSQQSNVLGKGLIIATVALSLLGSYRSYVSTSKLDSIDRKIGGQSPDESLSIRDGFGSSPDTVQHYTTVLNFLEDECTEGREEIAGIGLSIAQQYSSSGSSMNAYEGLTYLYGVARSETPGKTTCVDFYWDVVARGN